MAETAPSQRFSLWILAPGWASCVVLLALYPLFPAFFDRCEYVPFIVGMVFLGLPHGAQDHLVVPRMLKTPVTLRFLTAFMAGYAALVGLYLLFWRLFPAGALAVFFLFSLLHWGQGDAYAINAFAHIMLPVSRAGRALVWMVRGGLPIALSSLAFPGAFSRVANGIAGLFGAGHVVVLTATTRTFGLITVGVLVVLYLVQSWKRHGRGRVFFCDAGETLLLGLLFVRVPPVLAVGVYFCLWHALRHFGRLILLDPRAAADVQHGRLAQAFGRAARDSFPLTAVSLGMLAGLYFLMPRHTLTAEAATFLYLSLIAALTFPHFLLVLWMDRQRQTSP